jgi:hypothetical protein
MARRTTHEAEKLIDFVPLQMAPVSREVTAISCEVKRDFQSIPRCVDRFEGGIKTVPMSTGKRQRTEGAAKLPRRAPHRKWLKKQTRG